MTNNQRKLMENFAIYAGIPARIFQTTFGIYAFIAFEKQRKNLIQKLELDPNYKPITESKNPFATTNNPNVFAMAEVSWLLMAFVGFTVLVSGVNTLRRKISNQS